MNVVEWIRCEDPEYDPLAHVDDRQRLDAAIDRVYVDGYYGPIDAETWREQDGREPATTTEALSVLAVADEGISDWSGEVEGHPVTVERDDIRRVVWGFVFTIYGRLPW